VAGEQKRKYRKTLVTKAMLLGYEIVPSPIEYISRWYIIDPNGAVSTSSFPSQWTAAKAVLKLHGVEC